MAAFSFGVPLVLGGSESYAINLTGEVAVAPGHRIVENNFYCMVIVLVPVDQHQGPLPSGRTTAYAVTSSVPAASVTSLETLKSLCG